MSKREFRVLRGCINDGLVDLFHCCGDPNCKSCEDNRVDLDRHIEEYLDSQHEEFLIRARKDIQEYAKRNHPEWGDLTIEEIEKKIIEESNRNLNI